MTWIVYGVLSLHEWLHSLFDNCSLHILLNEYNWMNRNDRKRSSGGLFFFFPLEANSEGERR